MPQNPNDVVSSVGFVAGEIFHYLEQHGSTGDLNTLRRELRHVNEPILMQGMGWLMREGKLSAHAPSGETSNYMLYLRR